MFDKEKKSGYCYLTFMLIMLENIHTEWVLDTYDQLTPKTQQGIKH